MLTFRSLQLSSEQVEVVAMLLIIFGGYFAWLFMGWRKASRLRKGVSHTTDEDFLKNKKLMDSGVPPAYALTFKRFIESEYGLKARDVVAPDMTLDFVGSLSPHSPMVDDLEICYLLKRLETVAPPAAETLMKGTIADIIVVCWGLGIESETFAPEDKGH